jgi:membrane glycosyltransferase
MEGAMSMVEAGVLIFAIALFVIFAIVLAWEAHWEEQDRAARTHRFSDVIETPGSPDGAQSHQGADG